MDYNIYIKTLQDTPEAKINGLNVLFDVSSTGRIRPWRDKKIMNELLANIYSYFDVEKSNRLRNCADYLAYKGTGSERKLVSANFCRVRLCPICQWRRSLKLFAQVRNIFTAMEADGLKNKFIFMTLTVPNVSSDDIGETIDRMMKSWNKFCKYDDFQRRVVGFYRGMEITHNVETNMFHPHFHCVLAVRSSYFNSRMYFSQECWSKLWCRAYCIDNLIIDVRRVKGDPLKSIAEIVKYTVKTTDYIFPDDIDNSVSIVQLLDNVLRNRRFVSFGGIFKQYHKKLNLDDFENGDLLNVGDDIKNIVENSPEFVYVWNTGYSQYLG